MIAAARRPRLVHGHVGARHRDLLIAGDEAVGVGLDRLREDRLDAQGVAGERRAGGEDFATCEHAVFLLGGARVARRIAGGSARLGINAKVDARVAAPGPLHRRTRVTRPTPTAPGQGGGERQPSGFVAKDRWIWRAGASQRLDTGEDQEYLVAVKYRPSAGQFISVENQRGERSIFNMMRRHWPTLYFVLVTERPEAGRSCFQALSFETIRQGEPFRMVDLIELKEFGVFAHNVVDHEPLARRTLTSLTP